jgi:pilus assembly protein CpaC
MRFLRFVSFVGLVIFSSLPAPAQTAAPQADGRGPVAAAPQPAGRALHGSGASQIAATGAPIVLEVNKGTLVRLSAPAATVFIADPDIADVQVKSPSLIYITAKSPGETVIYAVDANDNVLLNSPVRVEHDLSRLRSSLRVLAPGERISADSVEGNLVLSGTVSDAGRAEKVQALAATVAKEAKGSEVINRLSVVSPNQVNLRVRVAEVDRNALKQIGVDWTKFNPNSNVSFETLNNTSPRNVTSFTTTATQTISNGLITVTPPTIMTSIPGVSFLTAGAFPTGVAVTFEALATEGFLTVLAEPNLTAVSGQTASFLAGGEYPVPVVQSVNNTGGAPAITIQYQQYGVQLAFTPTILDSHRISLKVRPEVSELSVQGAVTISGFMIPALTVRRAETTIELASGQTFALAGLMQHNTMQDVSKIPWLGDIPILGALFKSNQYQDNQTELVIIVTPYLVNPVATRVAAPTDGFRAPSDAQQVLFGDTHRQELPAPASGPLNSGGGGLIGPGGFRLD